MRSTQIVRYVMKRASKELVYTNLNVRSRTVKCYASKDPRANELLKNDIHTELARWGIVGARIVETAARASFPWSNGGIIVHLPL
jgi:hypothetical protein